MPEHQASAKKQPPNALGCFGFQHNWDYSSRKSLQHGMGQKISEWQRSRDWSIKGEAHAASKGSERGNGRRLAGAQRLFVRRSQRCSVPGLSGQMAGQHLLIRQEADKKYDLSLSQHGFSSSFFFQSVECIQSIICVWD